MSAKVAKKNTQKNNTSFGANESSTGRWMLIPVALIFGYLPLVMRTYQYDPGMSQFEWFQDGQVVDVYLASKMVVYLIIGFVMLCMFILYHMISIEKPKFEKMMIPLCIYFAGVLLSGIFSPYKAQAWGGSFEMFESAPVVMLYIFSAVYVFYHMHSREDFVFFWRMTSPGVFIECLISVGQMFGHDFIDTHMAKYLYLSPPYWDQMDTMVTGSGGAAYGTLYNPDFLPSYYAVIIPLSAAAFFSVLPPSDDKVGMALRGRSEKAESRRYLLERIFNAVIFGLAMLALYGCGTTAGVFVLIAALAILLVGDFAIDKKHIVLLVGLGILGLAVVFGLTKTETSLGQKIIAAFNAEKAYTDDVYVKNFYNKADEVEFVVSYFGEESTYHASMDLVDSVTVNPDTGEEVPIQVPVATLTCDNMDGITINPTDEAGTTQSATRGDADPSFYVNATAYNIDETYDDFGRLTGEARHGVNIYLPGHVWSFDVTEEGYKFRNFSGETIDFPSEVEYARVFSDNMLNGRGSLYNYTIPLLKKYIFIGAGSNTYVRVYPQNDYLTETFHSMDVKPHCFYMQQWTDNGLIATLALVAFYVLIVILLILTLVNTGADPEWKRGGFWRSLTLGCFTAVLCVMLSFLTNDSNLCTSPVVWVMLGISMVCIKRGRERKVIKDEQ